MGSTESRNGCLSAPIRARVVLVLAAAASPVRCEVRDGEYDGNSMIAEPLQPGSNATTKRKLPRSAFLLAAFALFAGSERDLVAQEMSELAGQGLRLVEQHCAKCHAVGRSDISPYPAAPPFRTLGRRYPPESLEEAFAEGIVVGHMEMPEFKFQPSNIGALIAYLKFVQRP